MTAFVAKMLTLFGVVLYAGGPIDAVTLIATGAETPETPDMLVEQMAPAHELTPLTSPKPLAAVVQDQGLVVDTDGQKSAPSIIEVGLRSGIGFD